LVCSCGFDIDDFLWSDFKRNGSDADEVRVGGVAAFEGSRSGEHLLLLREALGFSRACVRLINQSKLWELHFKLQNSGIDAFLI
jgi:hypothetical protein